MRQIIGRAKTNYETKHFPKSLLRLTYGPMPLLLLVRSVCTATDLNHGQHVGKISLQVSGACAQLGMAFSLHHEKDMNNGLSFVLLILSP
jgi:hypothetical protein